MFYRRQVAMLEQSKGGSSRLRCTTKTLRCDYGDDDGVCFIVFLSLVIFFVERFLQSLLPCGHVSFRIVTVICGEIQD